jgi:hypothetical protein
MPVVRWRRWRLSYSLQLAAALMLLVVLRWSKPEAGGVSTPTTSSIKLVGCSRDLGGFDLVAPLPCHRGGGGVDRKPDEAAFLPSSEQHTGADLLRAHHTMNKFVIAIFGQDDGPSSSSMAEALMINCWSSTLVEG